VLHSKSIAIRVVEGNIGSWRDVAASIGIDSIGIAVLLDEVSWGSVLDDHISWGAVLKIVGSWGDVVLLDNISWGSIWNLLYIVVIVVDIHIIHSTWRNIVVVIWKHNISWGGMRTGIIWWEDISWASHCHIHHWIYQSI